MMIEVGMIFGSCYWIIINTRSVNRVIHVFYLINWFIYKNKGRRAYRSMYSYYVNIQCLFITYWRLSWLQENHISKFYSVVYYREFVLCPPKLLWRMDHGYHLTIFSNKRTTTLQKDQLCVTFGPDRVAFDKYPSGRPSLRPSGTMADGRGFVQLCPIVTRHFMP